MKKILLDTSVLTSAFGNRANAPDRARRARAVLDFLEGSDEFTVCYSERTSTELSRPMHELERFEMVQYHWLNETIGQLDGVIENIGSRFGDTRETQLAESLSSALPDKRKKLNRRDRGIFGDAMYAGCSFLLHENPADFNRLVDEGRQHGLVVLNLLDLEAGETIQKLRGEQGRPPTED